MQLTTGAAQALPSNNCGGARINHLGVARGHRLQSSLLKRIIKSTSRGRADPTGQLDAVKADARSCAGNMRVLWRQKAQARFRKPRTRTATAVLVYPKVGQAHAIGGAVMSAMGTS